MKDWENRFDPERTSSVFKTDHLLIASVLLLTGLGLVTLYSASYAFGQRFFGDALYFITRQLPLGILGLLLFAVFSRIKLEWLRGWIGLLVVGTLILCALAFVPGIGVRRNGAFRWIRIGPAQFQPSELVKLVLPLYLAHIFDKKQNDLDKFFRGILPPVLITALFFLVIHLQNNFATALFITLNALFIFFLAGIRLRYFFGAVVILAPLSTLLVLTKPHRLWRVLSYVYPDWDPQGAGYQINASLKTIGSGGFWGMGIGQGTRKIASVPEVQSDFIFSSFSEESGFLGVFLFCLLAGVFAARGYRAALRSPSLFRRLLAFGLVTMIVSQILVNLAVVVGLLPATGIPLPFFSAGGSSLLATLAIAGLVVNISRDPVGELYVPRNLRAPGLEAQYVR
jgi:cell division protein FtsW